MKRTSKSVDTYIAAFPKPAQVMLKQLRAAIRSVAPNAEERISYAIPAYQYKVPGYVGRLAYFAGFKHHVSIYAWGREVNKVPGLKKYKTSTGTLRFPIGTKIPLTLIKQAVRARMKEIDAVVKIQ